MHRSKPASAAQHSSGSVGLQHSTGNVASSLPASVSHRSAPQSQPPAPVLHQRSPALQPTSVPHSHRNVDLQHPAPARHSAENLGLLQQPRTVQQLTFGNVASFPQCAPVHYRKCTTPINIRATATTCVQECGHLRQSTKYISVDWNPLERLR